MNHDQATTMHHLAAENSLDDGYWQEVFRECHYYEEDVSPHPPYPDDKGRQVGEFDVLCVNYDDQVAFYKEIKTKSHDIGHAERQIERAQEHFDDTEWEIIGKRVLEE